MNNKYKKVSLTIKQDGNVAGEVGKFSSTNKDLRLQGRSQML